MFNYLNERFINLELKTKMELYILALLVVYFIFYFHEKFDFFETKTQINSSFNSNIFNKKFDGTTALLYENIENLSKKNKTIITASSKDEKSINLKGQIQKEFILNYLNEIENLNNFTNIEFLKLIKNENSSTFLFELKIKIDKFYIKKLQKISIQNKMPFKDNQFKLTAIIDNYAFIDDEWIKKDEILKNYKLIKIEKNYVLLKNEDDEIFLEINNE